MNHVLQQQINVINVLMDSIQILQEDVHFAIQLKDVMIVLKQQQHVPHVIVDIIWHQENVESAQK